MKLSKKELRGGARDNAGRKPLKEKEKRKNLSTTVSPKTMKFLESEKNKGRAVDFLFEFYSKNKKKGKK